VKIKSSIVVNGKIIDFSIPLVMGILNVTPDSFYKESANLNFDAIRKRIYNIIDEGAAIIDIGGVSTRPGAKFVSENEEIKRLMPVVELLQEIKPDIAISIDTFRSSVVREIVKKYGQVLVNDISGGSLDDKMYKTIAELGLPYIIMHMQGKPDTMQNNPQYKNVTLDIIRFFSEKVNELKKIGVKDIIIDPGFGFGKSIEHNYELLYHLDDFGILELPVLVGVSRKSMIYKLLNITPDEALNGTALLHGLVGKWTIINDELLIQYLYLKIKSDVS